MGRILAVLIIMAALLNGTVGAAHADPITFIPNGPVEFKYNNFENLVTAVNVAPCAGQPSSSCLSGVLNVTTIGLPPTGSPIFWASGLSPDNTQLTGVFTDLRVDAITPVPGGQQINFTGGQLGIFNVGPNKFNTTLPPTSLANLLFDACGGACPAPWLTGNFSPSIVIASATVTLQSVVTTLTGPATGTGTGFIDVGTTIFFGTGANNGRFDTNGQIDANGNRHDLFLRSDVSICDPGNLAPCGGTFPVSSHDPVVGLVPEPSSLLLLGVGLMLVAAWRRLVKGLPLRSV